MPNEADRIQTLAEIHVEKIFKRHLKNVLKGIKKRAKEGKFEFVIDGKEGSVGRLGTELEELGYRIEKEKDKLTIRWGKKEES